MIRKIATAAALFLVAACSKAPEDMTAHYSIGGRGTMTVRAAANGDAKVEAGPQTLIRKGGTDYVVFNADGDRFAVKFDDFTGATGDMFKAKGMKQRPLPENPDYEAVQVGEEMVANQKGQIWSVRPKSGATGDTIRIVVSTDSTYAPIGKAFAMQTKLGSARMQQMFTGVSHAEEAMNTVLDKGMVLSLGDSMTLQDVAKGPIPANEFTLPKVLDRAAFRKRMEDEAAKAAAGAKPDDSATPAPTPAPSASPAK